VVLGSADRFLVQFYLGARQLGYYSAAYNISSSLQDSIISPLNLALFPIYMRLWVTKGKGETQTFISTIFNHFALASIGVIALVTLISRDGVILLATEKFQKAQSLVPLLVAALLVAASHFFIDPGLLIYRKTAVMARIAVYSTIVNVGLNVVLLPKLALLGAGLATLLTYLFMILLTIRPAFSLLPIPLQLDRLARYAAAAAIAVFLLRRLQLAHVFLDLLLKTTLCTVGYLALVWMLDSKFRTFVAGWLGLGFRPNVVAEMGSEGKSI
jgi:O-antigen/teichoic acid export membrane protein